MSFLDSKNKTLLFLVLTAIFLAGWTNVSADQHMVELVSLIPVEIKNQKIQEILPGVYLVEWETSISTTGKVFYDTNSVEKPGVDGEYGYTLPQHKRKKPQQRIKLQYGGLILQKNIT